MPKISDRRIESQTDSKQNFKPNRAALRGSPSPRFKPSDASAWGGKEQILNQITGTI